MSFLQSIWASGYYDLSYLQIVRNIPADLFTRYSRLSSNGYNSISFSFVVVFAAFAHQLAVKHHSFEAGNILRSVATS